METLTKREKEVYGLLTRGLSDKQLGEQLGISPSTAGLHVHRILRKLGYKRRMEIVLAEAGNRTELARMELEGKA